MFRGIVGHMTNELTEVFSIHDEINVRVLRPVMDWRSLQLSREAFRVRDFCGLCLSLMFSSEEHRCASRHLQPRFVVFPNFNSEIDLKACGDGFVGYLLPARFRGEAHGRDNSRYASTAGYVCFDRSLSFFPHWMRSRGTPSCW